jgi:exodeoxyribonuclease VIII
LQPGIYPDLNIKQYHSSGGISKTGLCKLDRSPRTYRDFIDNPGKSRQSKSLHTGSIFHIAMEGAFEEECRVGPEVSDKRSREWKEFVKAHPGKICVTPDEACQVMSMREAMYGYGPAREALGKPGRFEVSFYWIDRDTGLLCKCRPDWISADQLTVIDFKTAADATEERFVRSAGRLHYHVSAAMTVDGIHATTGILPAKYIFLAIEPHAPYLTAAYEATADDLAEGREFIRRNLALLMRCEEAGIWQGLPEEIKPLDVSRYMRRPRDEDESSADTDDTYSTPIAGEWWE